MLKSLLSRGPFELEFCVFLRLFGDVAFLGEATSLRVGDLATFMSVLAMRVFFLGLVGLRGALSAILMLLLKVF